MGNQDEELPEREFIFENPSRKESACLSASAK